MAQTKDLRQEKEALRLEHYDPNCLPVLAIVGRPNVGKSTLVNRIIGHRQSIVDDQPGVTRDRSFHPVSWCGTPFLIMDTGGVHDDPEDCFAPLINEQVQQAILEADVIHFVVDGRMGITEDDEQVARWVRASKKPSLLLVNKIDRIEDIANISEFYSLGLGEPMAISALHGSTTVGDALDETCRLFPLKLGVRDIENNTLSSQELPVRISLVGRPNVGKSSLLNALVGENRAIVSDISGTTRDAIDTPFVHGGQDFLLIDTAGIRRKSRVDFGVELFSVERSVEAMQRSHVVIVVLDAAEGITDQDKRIIQKAIDAGKGLIVAVNKWDLVPNKTPNSPQLFKKKLIGEVPSLSFAPFIFVSAMERQRIHQMLKLALTVQENCQRRVSTSVLNQLVHDAMQQTQPPTVRNKKLKVLYCTQASAEPPTFVLFINDNKLMSQTYQRYLERKLREAIELTGAPIRFSLKQREKNEVKS